MPSVLLRFWLSGRKGIRPVKKLSVGAGVVICLERGADLHMAQLMPLPLTVSCFSKIQIGFTFLVPAYLGSPGQRAIKRVCVCVVSIFNLLWHWIALLYCYPIKKLWSQQKWHCMYVRTVVVVTTGQCRRSWYGCKRQRHLFAGEVDRPEQRPVWHRSDIGNHPDGWRVWPWSSDWRYWLWRHRQGWGPRQSHAGWLLHFQASLWSILSTAYIHTYIPIYIAPKIVRTNLRRWHRMTRP